MAGGGVGEVVWIVDASPGDDGGGVTQDLTGECHWGTSWDNLAGGCYADVRLPRIG